MSLLLSGQHQSYWLSTEIPAYPPAPAKLEVDVAIVGGGLVGLQSAYFLQQQGKKVAVIEAERIGHGVSGHTTAQITTNHNLPYSKLVKSHGEEVARQYAQANLQAIEYFQEIITTEHLACEYMSVDDYLFTELATEKDTLKNEFDVATQLGLPVEYMSQAPVPFSTHGAIVFRNQAQFHPVQYMRGLASLIKTRGGLLFENSRVFDVVEGQPMSVQTEHGYVEAEDVIIATQYPILDRGGFFARMDVLRSYVIAGYLESDIPIAFYEDTEKPFHYVRFQQTDRGQLCMIGGEDHQTGTDHPEAKYQLLAAYAKSHFNLEKVEYFWSSQDSYSHDFIPFIGKYLPTSDHLWVATAFGGYGMTHSLIAGKLLTDLITHQVNPWQHVYSPQRFAMTTEIGNMAKQSLHVATTLVTGKLGATEKQDVQGLARNHGKIIGTRAKKIAAFKDNQDKVHLVSASCTHMGCTVAFNGAEKTWDCPCHGSRFSVDGHVLHGPAVKPLPLVEEV